MQKLRVGDTRPESAECALARARKSQKVFRWFRNRRRRHWQNEPLSPTWRDILQRHAQFFRGLPREFQDKLVASTQVLVAEKHWEGCGGLTMTDEVKVTVAAHASRLTLGFDDQYFDNVQTVLVYPDAYVAPSQQVVGPGIVIESHAGRAGEAWHRGPVILSWSDVLAGAHGISRGRNVVLHEFAHQLDLQNGPVADGIPVIESRVQADTWQRCMQEHFDALCRDCTQARATLLDCYGSKSQAEFFAVASEAFFEMPSAMRATPPSSTRCSVITTVRIRRAIECCARRETSDADASRIGTGQGRHTLSRVY